MKGKDKERGEVQFLREMKSKRDGRKEQKMKGKGRKGEECENEVRYREERGKG